MGSYFSSVRMLRLPFPLFRIFPHGTARFPNEAEPDSKIGKKSPKNGGYSALQMKLPTDFCKNVFGFVWPISGGSLPKLPLVQTPSSAPFFHHFLGDIPVYSSNEFLRAILAIEFALWAWVVELDSGKPKPAVRSHQICQHCE